MEEKKLSIREELISEGFQPGTVEFKKAYEAKKWRRKTPEQRSKKYKRVHAARMARAESDPDYREKLRKQWRSKSERLRKENRGEVNEYQREHYRQNRDHRLQQIKERRHERDPSIGLATLLQGVKRGDVTEREFLERARAAVDKFNTLRSRGGGEGLSRIGRPREPNPSAERTEPGQCDAVGRTTPGDNQTGSGGDRGENED